MKWFPHARCIKESVFDVLHGIVYLYINYIFDINPFSCSIVRSTQLRQQQHELFCSPSAHRNPAQIKVGEPVLCGFIFYNNTKYVCVPRAFVPKDSFKIWLKMRNADFVSWKGLPRLLLSHHNSILPWKDTRYKLTGMYNWIKKAADIWLGLLPSSFWSFLTVSQSWPEAA